MFLYSCEKDIAQEDEKVASLTEDQIDQNIKSLSEVVANAVYNNNELVKEIEKEISYRFDYDNDALITTFLGRKIAGEKFEDILSNSSNGKYSSKDIKKMILESGYLQFTFPQNYKSLNYESELPLVVPVYSFINEEDTEFLESYDKDGNTVKLSAKEMPNVPVIVVGRSERVDEDGYMLVSERSVVLPKEMRTLHYAEAIKESRNNLKSAKLNQHIVTILSQEEFDKLGGGKEPIVAADYKENLKSASFPGMELTGYTVKTQEMQLRWNPYTSGNNTSNRYKLYRDGTLISEQSGLMYTDIAPQANMVYTYIVEYCYNNVSLGISNDLLIHSSHRTSGGQEFIDRLYASHAMVVELEGWWVSELEIKWDILIGNPDATVSEVVNQISQSGGTDWDTQTGDGSRLVYDEKDVNLFTWNKGTDSGLSYTIKFMEDDGGTKTELTEVLVDITALVATTILTATGDLVIGAAVEAAKPSVKKIITLLRNDDPIGETVIYWWDNQAAHRELNAKGCYIEFSHR
jgi:hypothetical protein